MGFTLDQVNALKDYVKLMTVFERETNPANGKAGYLTSVLELRDKAYKGLQAVFAKEEVSYVITLPLASIEKILEKTH